MKAFIGAVIISAFVLSVIAQERGVDEDDMDKRARFAFAKRLRPFAFAKRYLPRFAFAKRSALDEMSPIVFEERIPTLQEIEPEMEPLDKRAMRFAFAKKSLRNFAFAKRSPFYSFA
ncbi:hypothetical protein AB6A40_002260 [Gnathostoma spinigerum]|uniref:Uncharacterized protein n=1 Tax=Gnathostoma spinigerum TaxID=75299 RepID=A0ABD6EDU5_9BILA